MGINCFLNLNVRMYFYYFNIIAKLVNSYRHVQTYVLIFPFIFNVIRVMKDLLNFFL